MRTAAASSCVPGITHTDPNACILTTEMLEAFNFWLQINKHKGALRNHSHISGD